MNLFVANQGGVFLYQTKRILFCVITSLAFGACAADSESEIEPVPEPVIPEMAPAELGFGDVPLTTFSHTGCGDLPPFLFNYWPLLNAKGLSASYSTDGFVDLTSEFATPQGSNGRSCASCHNPFDGWVLNEATSESIYNCSDGMDPLFNIRDANRRGDSDVSTPEARRASFSMLRKGKFVRNRAIPAGAEFECIAFDDPFNFGSCERIHNFRRAQPTASFRSITVSWDAGNTQDTLFNGLARQARNNITGAQEGDPAPESVIEAIVNFELNMAHAQIYNWGAGLLFDDGARGGPEWAAEQELVEGPFDLFDAWADSNNPWRRQIARGQELFNTRGCGGCHNAANNGQNVDGRLFDIGASDPALAEPDMAIYTFRNLATGEVRASTDVGRALRTGLWDDMDRFKTPNLRGLSQRAPYFHNGIAHTLREVVQHYENALGFDFTDQEERDLAAFLSAL